MDPQFSPGELEMIAALLRAHLNHEPLVGFDRYAADELATKAERLV